MPPDSRTTATTFIRAVNPASVVRPKDRYSQAITADVGSARLIVITGQQAWDEEGTIVGPGDMTAQATQVFEILRAVLREAQATFANVVKLTCFVTDMHLWPQAAAVRNRYLVDPPPASTVVQVVALTDPAALIEVEAMAVVRQ